MRTRTMASALLATVFVLTACGKEKEEADDNEASQAPSVATATIPDSAELAEQAALAKEAKVTEADARATALKEVPGAMVEAVELEKEDGTLIYSYDLKLAGKDGIEEVHIDAITGKMVSKDHESAKDEAKEKVEDAKKPAAAPAATKKGD